MPAKNSVQGGITAYDNNRSLWEQPICRYTEVFLSSGVYLNHYKVLTVSQLKMELKVSWSRSSIARKPEEQFSTVFSLEQLQLHFKVIAWMILHESMRNAPQWGDLSGGNLEAWKGGKTINPQNKYWKGRKKESNFILLHHLMSWACTGEEIYLLMFPRGAGSVKRWKRGWKIWIPNRKGQGTTERYFQIQWCSGHCQHRVWFLIRFLVVYGWVMQIPNLLEICMYNLRTAAQRSPGAVASL